MRGRKNVYHRHFLEHAASVCDAGETPPRGIKPDVRPAHAVSGPRRRCLPMLWGAVLDALVSHWAGGRRQGSGLNRAYFGLGDGSRCALRGSGIFGELQTPTAAQLECKHIVRFNILVCNKLLLLEELCHKLPTQKQRSGTECMCDPPLSFPLSQSLSVSSSTCNFQQ